jgi:hypothetical protein
MVKGKISVCRGGEDFLFAAGRGGVLRPISPHSTPLHPTGFQGFRV